MARIAPLAMGLLAIGIATTACERLDVYSPISDLPVADERLAECLGSLDPSVYKKQGDVRRLRCNSNVGKPIQSIEGIDKLIELEHVDVSFNQITDAAPLARLPRLQVLDAAHNDLVSLPASMISLTALNVENNEIENLDWISDYHSLVLLALAKNRITDLRPVAALPALRELRLAGNDIRDIEPLSKVHTLVQLDLGENEVADISPLAGLPALRVLRLSGNLISDLSPLASLAAIADLDLSHNPIVDISSLAKLTTLERLNLDGTGITDITPLLNLGRLEHVSLRGAGPIPCSQIDQLARTLRDRSVREPFDCG